MAMIQSKLANNSFQEEVAFVLGLVKEFHLKFNVGIGIRSQEEMYFRCNLLLEELSELAVALHESSNYEEELADVYYVLSGNIISMGSVVGNANMIVLEETLEDPQILLQDILIQCGIIAKYTRKKWAPEENSFLEEMLNLHLDAINKLYILANRLNIFDLLDKVIEKHEKNMKRSTKKVGQTMVISNWSNG